MLCREWLNWCIFGQLVKCRPTKDTIKSSNSNNSMSTEFGKLKARCRELVNQGLYSGRCIVIIADYVDRTVCYGMSD